MDSSPWAAGVVDPALMKGLDKVLQMWNPPQTGHPSW